MAPILTGSAAETLSVDPHCRDRLAVYGDHAAAIGRILGEVIRGERLADADRKEAARGPLPPR